MTPVPRASLLALLLSVPVASARAGEEAAPLPALVLTGDLLPRKEVTIVPRVGGTIAALHVEEGTSVTEGQILAEIDPKEYELAVGEAKVAVEIAQAKLAAVETGGRPEEKRRAAAEVESAEAVEKEALGKHERVLALRASGNLASKQDLDQAKRELDVARSKVTVAREAFAMVADGARVEDKTIARAELARARIQLERAELDLARTKIRAPFAGVISQRDVDPGAFVGAAGSSQAPGLFVLSDVTVLTARVEVAEADLARAVEGRAVTLEVPSAPGHTFHGQVVRLHPRVELDTRGRRVDVEIPNGGGQLLPGMFARVKLEAMTEPDRSVAGFPAGAPAPATTGAGPRGKWMP